MLLGVFPDGVEEGNYPGHTKGAMADAGHFQVNVLHPQFPHLGNPGPRGRCQIILIALQHEYGEVFAQLQCVGFGKGPRVNDSKPGPDIRVLTCQMVGARAAHGVAKEIDTILVDIEFATGDFEDTHHILLGQAPGAAGIDGAVPTVPSVSQGRYHDVALFFGQVEQGVKGHDRIVCAFHAMEADHNRIGFRFVVGGGDKKRVGYLNATCFGEFVGSVLDALVLDVLPIILVGLENGIDPLDQLLFGQDGLEIELQLADEVDFRYPAIPAL